MLLDDYMAKPSMQQDNLIDLLDLDFIPESKSALIPSSAAQKSLEVSNGGTQKGNHNFELIDIGDEQDLTVEATLAEPRDDKDRKSVSDTPLETTAFNTRTETLIASKEHRDPSSNSTFFDADQSNEAQSNVSESDRGVIDDAQQLSVEKKLENRAKAAKLTKLDVSPYTIIAPFCSVETLMSLSQVSRSIREAVIADSIWTLNLADLIEKDSTDKAGFVTAGNVLQSGFNGTAFQTWLRAYYLMTPIIEQPENLDIHGMNAVEIAQTLGNAEKFATRLDLEDSVRQQFLKVVSGAKTQLLEDLSSAVVEREPTAKLLEACNIWHQLTRDKSIEHRALDLIFQNSLPALEADSVFSFNGDNERTASQRKIGAAFGNITSSLINQISGFKDPACPLPLEWKASAWHFVLSKALTNIVIFVQSVLTEATEINESEYLQTVPKVFSESKTLGENSILKEYSDDVVNVQVYLQGSILKPMLDEFCERQISFVEQFNRKRVEQWVRAVNQREFETEEFLWSSVPKKSDKTNFMSGFKWAFSSGSETNIENSTNNRGALESGSAPETEFEAQTAVLVAKLKGMENLVSFELALETLNTCKAGIQRLNIVERANAQNCEPLFCSFLKTVGRIHIRSAFEKAIKVLNTYDPKKFGRLVIPSENNSDPQNEADSKERYAVEPLAVFAQLVNVSDLVQQMVHVFFQEELVATKLVKQSNFAAPSVNEKRHFEQMVDDYIAEGLSRGIDVLMDQVEFTFSTEQLGSDYLPAPTQHVMCEQTQACKKVISLVKSHLDLLRDSTEKGLFDVFQQEVGMRLFNALSKHLKKQTISIDGAVNLIIDTNAFYDFIVSLKQTNLLPYYEALKQIAQLFLIDKRDAKQIGVALSDNARYNNIMSIEELVEFIKRRQDWPLIKHKVDKVLYGLFDCVIM